MKFNKGETIVIGSYTLHTKSSVIGTIINKKKNRSAYRVQFRDFIYTIPSSCLSPAPLYNTELYRALTGGYNEI